MSAINAPGRVRRRQGVLSRPSRSGPRRRRCCGSSGGSTARGPSTRRPSWGSPISSSTAPPAARSWPGLPAPHEPSLYRVLRLLAALGVFNEVEPGSFGLTVLGDRLRSDVPAGMRSWAVFLEAIGGSPALRAHPRDGQDRQAGHGHRLRNGCSSSSSPSAPTAPSPSTRPCPTEPRRSRPAWPAPTTSRIFAASSTSAAARAPCWRRSCAGTRISTGRCSRPPMSPPAPRRSLTEPTSPNDARCVAGNFFERVPGGADCYVLANVLHDWDDQRAIDILAQLPPVHGQGRQGADRRTADPRWARRRRANPLERHQHARHHRRARAHQRRVREPSRGSRPEDRHRPSGRVPVRRH